MFIHFSIVSPYLNDNLSFFDLTELCDEENESEKEEIENENEFEIINCDFTSLFHPILNGMESQKINYQLNYYSEVTTPPPDLS